MRVFRCSAMFTKHCIQPNDTFYSVDTLKTRVPGMSERSKIHIRINLSVSPVVRKSCSIDYYLTSSLATWQSLRVSRIRHENWDATRLNCVDHETETMSSKPLRKL